MSNALADRVEPKCSPSIGILLASYNGERFFAQQLNSILAQSYEHWTLYISDDGSNDATLTIARDFAELHPGKIILISGPSLGFVENFLYLVDKTLGKFDFYCFCDQDDIWLPKKCEQAILQSSKSDQNLPFLYCGATELIDERGCTLMPADKKQLHPCFKNALVQNIASGNTMMFNNAGAVLIGSLEPALRSVIPAHDWWAYQILTAAGGVVHFDPVPYVRYRQHSQNIIGSGHGMKAYLLKISRTLTGTRAAWYRNNVRALNATRHFLTPDSNQTLRHFGQTNAHSFVKRLVALYRSGVRRQRWPGTLGLFLFAAFNKLLKPA